MSASIIDINMVLQTQFFLEQDQYEYVLDHQLIAKSLERFRGNPSKLAGVILNIIKAKDPATAIHSKRVANYCIDIGRRLKLPEEEVRFLETGAILHDIGKIAVPKEILLKPDKLTHQEYEAMKAHPQLGCDIISGIPELVQYLPIVRWHHERLDKTGYPDGLGSQEIPLNVRIVTVADAFDAMTSRRCYQQEIPLIDAIGELDKDKEKGKLDPHIVNIISMMVQEHLNEINIGRSVA